MLKDSSGIDQPQYGQSWFRELRAQRQSSSLSSSSLSSLSSEASQVRSLNQWSQGSVSRSKDHVASHGSSQKMCVSVKGSAFSTQIIISSTLYHLSKIRFQPTFDSAVFISLPLRDFGFSSPVIVIVKIQFYHLTVSLLPLPIFSLLILLSMLEAEREKGVVTRRRGRSEEDNNLYQYCRAPIFVCVFIDCLLNQKANLSKHYFCKTEPETMRIQIAFLKA